ncbi:exo-alpha-sialidase [Hamadaea sp. NPDC051192]|uniref:golvesin C-terminal-like domain-containing protein n=1 Tax=Hamadaea sp. NPDC051192 TaxID=3154940 RepID=UPI00342FA05F
MQIDARGPATAAPGSFAETELWDATDTGDPYARFHVQAFAVLPDDTVLAVTEGRFTDADASEKDLVLRRSTDGGATWSVSVIVVPDDPALTNDIGSPALIVDAQTGSVFLFYRGISPAVYYKRSDDSGLTWSAPTNLAALFTTNPNGWTSQSPTPGHGIQLSTGRLLLPFGHRAPDPDPNYGDDAIYSDDHGVTWQRGAPVPFSVDYPIGESRVVERADGSVVINGRWGSGGTHHRLTAISADGGATWSRQAVDAAIPQFVAVDAGLIKYTGGTVNRWLLSRPDASARENLTVSVSYDEGASYKYSRVVNAGPSYYSDLARLSDGTILLIYGRDGTSRGFPERISVARFDLDWLTSGRDSLAAGPGFTQTAYELATSSARTDTGAVPTLTSDVHAQGGKRVQYAPTADGTYVEAPFTVATAGTYALSVRHDRGSDRGKLRTSVDGVDLPYGRVDPTMTIGDGYQVYPLGSISLPAGAHTIRFTVDGVGRSGGRVIAADQLVLTQGGGAADGVRTIADNNAAASFELTGTWPEASTPLGYYGQFFRTHAAGTGTAVARWRPEVPATGVYEVAVYYPPGVATASNAPYTVNHADGSTTVRVDQRSEGSRWVVLGAYSFVAGDTATIALTDDANGTVVADAVRLVRLGGVADNDTASFTQVSGAWNNATGVTGYYGVNYRTAPAGTGTSVASWTTDVPVAGVYQVEAWYTASSNRATNAPYIVNHAGGSATVRVDQTTRGSQWVPLGAYSFAAGTATVSLSNDADGYVVADAVRLVSQGIVGDNAASGFTVVSGTWNNNASGVAGYYGSNYGTSVAGTGSSRVRWTLSVPADGVYQVAVWYTADPNRATNAPYLVAGTSGTTTVRVNQQARNGQWVSLGEFSLAAGTTTVDLTNDADGYVVADAVRLLRQR